MDTLTIALEKVDLPPPDRVTDNTSVLTLKNLVLEPLVGWDAGRATPALFSHWIHSPDGRRWEFFIRSGAVFHDGRPCRPGDILAIIETLRTSRDTFGMPWSYGRYLARARLSAGAGGSVVLENPEPFADILDIFSEFYPSRSDASGDFVVGTGPWRVVAHDRGRQVVVERCDSTDRRRIVLDAAPDAGERWRRLCDGRADAAIHLDHMEHPPPQDPRFLWRRRVSPLSVMAYLRCGGGLFASAEARLAANLAIDRRRLAAEVFHGLAEPAATIVGPTHLGMAEAELPPIPFDPDRARMLLDRAGGSREIILRTPETMPERAPEISRFVAEALTAVGFEVAIEMETNRPDYARQVARKEIGDLALFDSSPHSTFRVLNDKISSVTRAIWWQGYDNPGVERLIRVANAAVDAPARGGAYAACLRALQEDPPWLYLVHPVNLMAARPDVPGVDLTAKGTLSVAGP